MKNIAEQRYYFDTNALLKYYNSLLKHFQEEQGILRIRRLVANSYLPILISPMTSLELVGKVTALFRQKLVPKKTLRTIITHLRKDIGINPTSRPFEMLELSDNVFRLVIPSPVHGHIIMFLNFCFKNQILPFLVFRIAK